MTRWAHPDSQALDLIGSFNLEQTYLPNLSTATFVADWEGYNPGREQQKIDPDEVLPIAEAIENDVAIRPLIVWKQANGYEIADGRRRASAVILNDGTEVAAYEIRGPRELCERLAKTANLKLHGRKPGAAFAKRIGSEFVREGLSVKEAARLVGVAASTLEEHLNSGTAARILERNGFEVPAERRNGVLAALCELGPDDEKHICKTWELIDDANLTSTEAKREIAEISKQRGSGRLAAIEAIRGRPEIKARIKGNGTRAVPPLAQVLVSLRGAQTSLVKHGDKCEIRTQREAEDITRLGRDICARLEAIYARSPLCADG